MREVGWFVESHPLNRDDRPAQVTYTSGTEGQPKGVVLTYSNLADAAERIIVEMELTSDVREYVGVPVTYSFGLGRIRAVSAAGGRSYLPPRGFDPLELSRMLTSGEVNALSAVPTLLRILLQMPDIIGRAGRKLRWLEIGNASDDYVRGFATYVRDHLPGNRRIHVEFSNEVWNFSIPQTRYAETRAREVFGPDVKWLEWYGKRAAEVGMIWKDVFGEAARHDNAGAGRGRVLVVFNTQFGWQGLEDLGLDTVHWRDADGRHVRASDYFDEYAITGYYDGTMNTQQVVDTVMGWWQDADGGYGRAIAALRYRITNFNAPYYVYHAGRAARRGLRLVTYESGFGEYTPPGEHRNEAYTIFLARLQRRPEFHELETANYAAFKAAGGSLYMNFGIIATPGKWGNWAALESVDQKTSPRYQALIDWMKANPSPAATAAKD